MTGATYQPKVDLNFAHDRAHCQYLPQVAQEPGSVSTTEGQSETHGEGDRGERFLHLCAPPKQTTPSLITAHHSPVHGTANIRDHELGNS